MKNKNMKLNYSHAEASSFFVQMQSYTAIFKIMSMREEIQESVQFECNFGLF